MSDIVFDSMAGTNWQDLHQREGELGATWTRHPATGGCRFYIFGNQVHCGVPGELYASGVPPSPDYTVSCDYTVKTLISHVGIAGRMSLAQRTYYFTYLDPSGHVILAKMVNGVVTTLDFAVGVMSVGQSYLLELVLDGDDISVQVNGTPVCGETDSSITAAGRVGVRSASVNDAQTGKHIDNFRAFDASIAATPRTRASLLSGL